jgi:hypothetical protein
MSDIKWQAPPASKTDRTKWARISEQLRGRPGEWALVAERVSRATGETQCRKYGLERTVRSRKDGQFDVYARFVGEVSA